MPSIAPITICCRQTWQLFLFSFSSYHPWNWDLMCPITLILFEIFWQYIVWKKNMYGRWVVCKNDNTCFSSHFSSAFYVDPFCEVHSSHTFWGTLNLGLKTEQLWKCRHNNTVCEIPTWKNWRCWSQNYYQVLLLSVPLSCCVIQVFLDQTLLKEVTLHLRSHSHYRFDPDQVEICIKFALTLGPSWSGLSCVYTRLWPR